MPHEPILIIDDDPASLKLLKLLLDFDGYDVRTATDAHEALKTLEEFQPALILMDVQLPDIDGLDLTRKLLKSDKKYKNTIILGISAYGVPGDDEIALAAGCDGYITKPIDPQAFPALIADYLKKRKTT